jgi:hypothetical protein
MSLVAALLDHSLPAPQGLRHGHRIRIYRNNVASALIQALAVRYPAVKRVAGDGLFSRLAGGYAQAQPPGSAVLIAFGEGFPEFIAAHEDARHLPFLADLARLESAWWRAYHAEDAVPASTSALAGVPPEELMMARLRMIPSLSLVASPHAVAGIWQGLEPEGLSAQQTVLVARPGAEVVVRVLSTESAGFITALARGVPLGEAVDNMFERFPGFDLTAQLGGLISLQIVHSIEKATS